MSEQAGRELDALIAEKVMGAKHSNVGTAEWMHFPTTGPYADCDCERHIEAIRCPEYSTSITAAWEVVSALEGKSMFLTLSRNQIPNDANGQQSKWDVYFWDNGKQMAHDTTASTVPLAICLAALKAVGEGKS